MDADMREVEEASRNHRYWSYEGDAAKSRQCGDGAMEVMENALDGEGIRGLEEATSRV